MRILGVIKKSLKEQIRSFWLLILTIITAPFFVVVYNLISESYAPVYDILVLNNDKGIITNNGAIDLGDSLINNIALRKDKACRIGRADSRIKAFENLKNKKAD